MLERLHSYSSRSVCIAGAAGRGLSCNKEQYLYHRHCKVLSLPFVPVMLMASSAMGALAKEEKNQI